MDNGVEIDLHTASVMLKKHDHSISLCQYVSYIQRTTAVTCRTSFAAPRMLAWCPVTVDLQ